MSFSRSLPILVLGGLCLLIQASSAHAAAKKKTGPPASKTGDESSQVAIAPERVKDMAYWEQAVAAAPDDVTLRLALGNAYAMNNREGEAVREYRKVLAQYPDYKEAWNNLGSAYRAMNRRGAALGAYRKAIAIDPHYALAYYNIGVVYDSEGRYERAIDYYGVAVRSDPKLLELKSNPQVVTNRHLYAVLLHNYVASAGTLALPLEPAYPETPAE